jgi:hypothetical protein
MASSMAKELKKECKMNLMVIQKNLGFNIIDCCKVLFSRDDTSSTGVKVETILEGFLLPIAIQSIQKGELVQFILYINLLVI